MEQFITHKVMLVLALIAVIAPFLAFLTYALGGKRQKSGVVSTVAIAISLLLSLFLAISAWNRELLHVRYDWFTIGTNTVTVGILVNNLSLVMLVLVPLVALPVHIYSFSYMKGDTGLRRYWMYLSLFCFAMLGLVVADSLFLLYMCWELVGFASYLLIGFWYERDAAIKANKKAFLINRLGDLGFLIGLAILFSEFGTWDLAQLFGHDGLIAKEGGADASYLTWAGLAFFLAAMAKSAQFPLHIWLPDAMEGPTAVSSLIHAATMVAAGVFLLARVSPLFNDTVLMTIATVGSITAFVAASIALTQRDIKRVLAFSTISQLGFMMVAIGIGQIGTAIFHLVTHAFFKCLLFLCAGAVIHEIQHQKEKHKLQIDPQDIGLMGGLRKTMPSTFVLSLIGAAALAGLPLTAGYLSKDALLIFAFEWANYQAGFWVFIPLLLMIASGMTAFYIARWLFKIFYGQNRLSLSIGKAIHYHEAPVLMRWPMVLLAGCCLFFVFSYNPLVFEDTWLLNGLERTDLLQRVNIYHTVIPAAINSVSIVLIFLAWRWYAKGKYPLKGSGMLYDWSYHQYGLNRLYEKGVVKPLLFVSGALYRFDVKIIDGLVLLVANLVELSGRLAAWVDRYVLDGAVNGVGNLAQGIGMLLRNGRKGKVQRYLLGMLIVFLLMIIYANFI
ncbi:NADH-quinone oxidoreductase subunit L [Olivibacter sitiensis]|uniref:NADH-quinone oxidoreductase subunit L n=1 Tax=Olivibacter sitiensis TaxID=376470 RepID=UPI000403CD79|nr:NADH-quinone oxidoreductase subunit L [Olivibacter sitiensis]